MNAVIIEDEPHARMELKRLLAKVWPNLNVVGEADSVSSAIMLLRSDIAFDLIFADIQLADGLSFGIFNQVPVIKPIIFTTAYNEFAIQAFELNSIDYLLKPIEEQALAKAMHKLNNVTAAYTSHSIALTAQKLSSLFTPVKEYKTRFVVKIGDQFKYIAADDIAHFEADDNVVYAYSFDGNKSLVDYKMEVLETVLNPAVFFRINRGSIVHIRAIQKVHKYFNSRLRIDLAPQSEEPLLVSRLKVDDFIKWLDQ
ncbi:MAG: LytTR family DNA-binding domain-containing protein [Bacteroidia bacterium]|jgi:DNA-binding LytR/AlgR family response regulator|nr:LytTR family DNA-binding domain-containing protein [Bacteroidia bacterium]